MMILRCHRYVKMLLGEWCWTRAFELNLILQNIRMQFQTSRGLLSHCIFPMPFLIFLVTFNLIQPCIHAKGYSLGEYRAKDF
jgi:hypothetical protein